MFGDPETVDTPAVEPEKKTARRKARKPVQKKVAKKKAAKKATKRAKAARPSNGQGKKGLPVTRHTVPDKTPLRVAAKWKNDNPKSPMSPSAQRFELYKKVSTVGEYRDLMRKHKKPHFANLDLKRDYDRGYIQFKIG